MPEIQKRWKAVVALAGGLINWLYQVNAAVPNKYITLLLFVLTAVGVHQVINSKE